MRHVLIVVFLAVSVATIVNTRQSEHDAWIDRIQQMNEEGLEWEASRSTYKPFSRDTEEGLDQDHR